MFNRFVSSITRQPPAVKSAPRANKALSPAQSWGREEVSRKGIEPYLWNASPAATKSISMSREIVDFINDGGAYGTERYSEIQLENAFRTSHYLYAALKKVARMVSTVPVVAEGGVAQDTWVRLPETHPLNLLINNSGRRLWYESYLFHAMFGGIVTYKERTPPAVALEGMGRKVKLSFPKGMVKGLHVIPNVLWQLDESSYGGEIRGIQLNTSDTEAYDNESYLDRDRFIYVNDFDPRDPNRGISIVQMSINSAVTNAAIQRFAAHYFMSGAMPMLLVQPETDANDEMGTQADVLNMKNRFEEVWRGIFSRFSLRSMFVNQRYKVDQVGIKAEEVSAPELNNETLKAICSVVGIAPDLIIPPEGGSDNARHKHLIKQALTDTVIPFMQDLLSAYNDDLGLTDARLRLVVAEDLMPGLEADRADNATTETSLWAGGIQSMKESRTRINLPEEIEDNEIFMINGKPTTYKRLVRNAGTVDADMLQWMVNGWNDGVILRSEFRVAFGLAPQVDEKPDGFKYEVVPAEGGGGFGGGGFGGGGGSTPPQLPPDGGGDAPMLEAGDDVDADKSLDDGEWEDTDADFSTWGTLDEIDAWLADDDEEGVADADTQETVVTATAGETEAPVVTDSLDTADAAKNDTLGEFASAPDAEPATAPIDEVSLGYQLAAPEPAAPQPEPVKNAGYVYLSLANEDQLVRVQEQVKALCPSIELEDPAHLHITLAYSEDITDAAFNAACALTPDAPRVFSVRVERLNAFPPEHEGGKFAIVLDVELDMRLSAIQQRVSKALQAQGAGVSEHTVNWHPHITLGYCETMPESLVLDVTMGVTPLSVCWSRDDYHITHEGKMVAGVLGVENPSPELVQELHDMTEMFREKFTDLLRTWQTNGEAPRVLPPRIREWVTEALQERDANAVFVAALRCAADGAFDDEAVNLDNPVIARMVRPAQATPEQELAAWENSARKNFKKAAHRFETTQLPAPIAESVRKSLKSEMAYNETIKQVFSTARNALASYDPPTANDETLAEWAASIAGDSELMALIEGDEQDGTTGASSS